MDSKSIKLSKFVMIIEHIDHILVNKNPLKSIFIHKTLVRVVSFLTKQNIHQRKVGILLYEQLLSRLLRRRLIVSGQPFLSFILPETSPTRYFKIQREIISSWQFLNPFNFEKNIYK